jgi:hypothetical protein
MKKTMEGIRRFDYKAFFSAPKIDPPPVMRTTIG